MKKLLLFVLMLLPMVASADDSGKCGENVYYSYNSATRTLTISGTGEMEGYRYYEEWGDISTDNPWYSHVSEILSINIEYGITSIGECDFINCYGLTSIIIPNSVTSIGSNAFRGCSGLTSVTIPSSVTCIGSGAFQGCSNLTSITIPNSVTVIKGQAFHSCGRLTSITIPKSVTNIGAGAFYGTAWYNNQPDGLVYAGKLAYKYKGEMPANMQIIIKDGTQGIADDAFFGCTGLTSVTIPNSVTSIGYNAFSCCSGLTSVPIPNSVSSIGNSAFSSCSGLTSIIIPDGVTFIDMYAFSGCSGLTSIIIPNSVTFIGSNAFRGCIGLTSVSIGNGVTSIEKQTFAGCTSLASISIANTVTSIGSEAFYGCTSLTSVTIPSSVTNIGLNAFGNCPDRTSITVENGNMYYDSRNNCNAIIDNNNQLIVGCKNTNIPNSVTSIGEYAFAWCNGLTSMNIPNSVTSIGEGAFESCGLTSINIPNSVSSIGNYAFMFCSSLVYITLSDKLTSIGSSAFSDCYSLSDVYCKAAIVPNAELYSFIHPEDIVLHVPFRSLNAYESTEPWSKFKNIVSIYDSNLQASEKCSKPTISIVDGNAVFSCETPSVSYRWSVSTPNGTSGGGEFVNTYSVRLPVTLSVYATKSGYLNSDVATYVFPNLAGDVNNDGVVNVADHVKLSHIILDQ